MAELIVSGSLFGIGEHIVRLGRLLELLLGLLIPRILVRVILDSRLSVSLLYLIRVGVLRHAQALRSNLVFSAIVFECRTSIPAQYSFSIVVFSHSTLGTIVRDGATPRPLNENARYSPTTTFAKRNTLSPILITGLYHIDDLALLLLRRHRNRATASW